MPKKPKTTPEPRQYLVTRATIEYSHAYVMATSEEAAIEAAKECHDRWEFDSYSSDGELDSLAGAPIEYDAEVVE